MRKADCLPPWLRSSIRRGPILCYQSNRWLRFSKSPRLRAINRQLCADDPTGSLPWQNEFGATTYPPTATAFRRLATAFPPWLRSSIRRSPILCYQSNRWLRFSKKFPAMSYSTVNFPHSRPRSLPWWNEFGATAYPTATAFCRLLTAVPPWLRSSGSCLRPYTLDFTQPPGTGSFPPVLEPIKVEIYYWCSIQRENLAHRQAADNGDSQRAPQL